MNERILDLAEQAGIAVWGDAVYMYHPTDTLDSAVLEKFAELIVKECIQAIQNESKDPMDELEYGLRVAEGAILDHFGVEE